MRISDWSSDVGSSDLEQAAWAVVLEAATVEVHAAGEQRGGEGGAGEALVAPPIEGEAERPAAVDEAAAVETKAAHATPRPRFCSAPAPGPPTPAPPLLSVPVSTATFRPCPQHSPWCQPSTFHHPGLSP